ncbi:hypothetical protein [Oryza sativa Japonica Group]|uniref:Protein SirB1 N-terminal domain-containing protein n=1 Tax=Oryza sativa subsp. japonica TaxID=39947 RepID=Q9LIY4_ORYSJ|nr:hypothetical protein [Oryza sativa Japonica Group]
MSCAAVWVPSPCSPSPVPPRHRRGRWRRGSASSSSSSAFRACAGGDASGDGGGGGRPARMVLHDSLEGAGVSTEHARAAREGFAKQVGRLTRLDAETSIAISRGADLARAALCVAAEDDSLVSHSSVPLPVEAFVSRLDDLSTGFLADGYLPPAGAPPQVFLDHLDRYLYVHKVLTCRLGSALMLSLIYSEILKMLRLYGLLEFNVEIFFPHDLNSLPRGYDKHKSKLGDEPHIMTSKSLLVEILKTLKNTFWPFQSNQSGSLFLNAVSANQHGPGNVGDNQTTPHGNISTIEMAAAKAAQHRLMRGVWTNVRFGDMRRALAAVPNQRFVPFIFMAACERLILLNHDPRELRDYAALLYHCWAALEQSAGDHGGRSGEHPESAGKLDFSRGWLEQPQITCHELLDEELRAVVELDRTMRYMCIRFY